MRIALRKILTHMLNPYEELVKDFDEMFLQTSFTPPKEANLGDSILITIGSAREKKNFLLSSHLARVERLIDEVEKMKTDWLDKSDRSQWGEEYTRGEENRTATWNATLNKVLSLLTAEREQIKKLL